MRRMCQEGRPEHFAPLWVLRYVSNVPTSHKVRSTAVMSGLPIARLEPLCWASRVMMQLERTIETRKGFERFLLLLDDALHQWHLRTLFRYFGISNWGSRNETTGTPDIFPSLRFLRVFTGRHVVKTNDLHAKLNTSIMCSTTLYQSGRAINYVQS